MAQMEHSSSGHISLGVSMIGWILSRIDVSSLLKDASTVIAIGAGVMAIIHYYYSIKKIKNNGTK